MAKLSFTIIFLVLLAACVYALPSERVRRGYNSGGYDSGGGYGRGSDERDASVSEEGGGCSGGSGYSGRGSSYSGSREVAYSKDGRQSGQTRGGRSFSKTSASAAASATAYSMKQKANVV